MTDTRPATRIIELPTQWLREHMHEALTIYGLAMGYDSAVVAGRYGYAVQHTERPGFRAVGAFAESPDGEQLVGFGYGYLVAPGQWWHDQVRAALDRRTAKKWLPGAFEVCELHVHPEHQSRGLGRRLLHALVADSGPARTGPRAPGDTLFRRAVDERREPDDDFSGPADRSSG